MSKKAVFRILEIFGFGMIAVLLALLFYPLQKKILADITAVRDACIAIVEERLDKKISYLSMGPSIFGALDFREVAIYNNDGAPYHKENALISIDRLRIGYSFWDIICGNPQGAVSSIIIDRPLINFDSTDELKKLFASEIERNTPDDEHDEASIEMLGAKEDRTIAQLREIISQLPEGFKLRIKQGAVRMQIAGNHLSLNSFSLDSSVVGKSLTLKADWKAEAALNYSGKESFLISIPGKADGRFDFEAVRGDFNVVFPEISTKYFALRRTRILTVWTENYMTVRKIDDSLPYDILFSANFDTSTFNAKLSADNFSFANIITLKGALAEYNPWITAKFSGGGTFQKSEGGGVVYNADFTGALHNTYPIGKGFFVLSASGNEKSVRFKNLKLDLARGAISYNGSLAFTPVSPNGTLQIQNFYFGKDGKNGASTPVTGELVFSSSKEKIAVFASELRFADSMLSAFDIEAVRNGKHWALALSALCDTGKSDEDPRVASITMQADLNLDAQSCSATGRIESFVLQDLITIAGAVMEFPQQESIVQNFTNDIDITTEVSFDTNFKNVFYKVPRLVMVYHGVSDISSVSSLYGSDKMFDLSECHIEAGGGIDIKARADYADANNVSFLLESTINKTPYRFEGTLINNKTIAINGSYLSANAILSRNGSFNGSMIIDSLLLPTDAKNSILSMTTDFSYTSKTNWNIDINTFDIDNIIYNVVNASSVHLSGNINQDRMFIPELLLDDGKDPLKGEARLSFKQHDTATTDAIVPQLLVNVTNTDRSERLDIQAGLHANSFDAHIQADDFKVYRFLHNPTDIALNGVIDFSFESAADFNVVFNLESLNGHIAGKELLLACRGSLNAEKAEVSEAQLNYAGFAADLPFISIDRKQRVFETIVRLNTNAGTENLYADVQIQSEFSDTHSWFDIPKAIQKFSGSIDVSNAYFLSSASLDAFTIQFSRLDNLISVSGGPDDMLDAQIDTTGAFYASLSAPSPLIGTVAGVIKDDLADINASNLYIDIDKLWSVFPEDIVVQGTGGFVLADIHIKGRLSDPSIFGVANGYGVRVKIPDYLSSEVGPAPITVHFEGKRMYFDPIVASSGDGEGYITGSFDFDRWIPSNSEINIAVNKDNKIPYAVDIAGIKSSGLVNGNIMFRTIDNNLLIAGSLTSSDSIITMDAATPEERQARLLALNKDPNLYIETDISINADRGVEFLWPNEDYPILRTNLELGDSLRITSDSLSGKSTLVGHIGLRGGELFYFQRSFYIKSGELVFNENEIKFEPRISALAETREQSEDGPVLISIIINDQSINSFTPILRSEPPLSQVAILSILGNAVSGTPDDESNTIARPFLASTTDLLAQFQIVRRVERRMRDILHVDIFSARTQALQNALFQAAFATPEESEPGIWSYFDNTTILLGKYLTPNLFLRSMIAASYDKNKLKNDGLGFDLSIGVELTSPLFNVSADVNPFHSSLWIPDTSITLSRTWRLP
ncbi:MAG: translocation/assembly module TamB [Spirochaetaceae bacterium]|nr:translocation/assembly module TamB [Spirochaetaceae bacterium]